MFGSLFLAMCTTLVPQSIETGEPGIDQSTRTHDS